MTVNVERYGLDLVLSMIKLRGFGGKASSGITISHPSLMAGLAAVTSRIKPFATVPTLAVPPAVAARLCSTIDSISNGRFGLNVITGLQRPEYSQMGLWRVIAISATATNTLPSTSRSCTPSQTGVSDLEGEFFTMNDCRLSPARRPT